MQGFNHGRTLMVGQQGMTTVDGDILNDAIGLMQEIDPAYFGVTRLGRCSDENVPCDCLQCEYRAVTTLDYTVSGQVLTARVFPRAVVA